MTEDTVLKIKNTENDCKNAVERESLDAADRLRRLKSECELRLAEERKVCRSEFDKSCAEADAEAAELYSQAEEKSFTEAEAFVRSAGSRLPDAVKFIVGGIIGKWR